LRRGDDLVVRETAANREVKATGIKQ